MQLTPVNATVSPPDMLNKLRMRGVLGPPQRVFEIVVAHRGPMNPLMMNAEMRPMKVFSSTNCPMRSSLSSPFPWSNSVMIFNT